MCRGAAVAIAIVTGCGGPHASDGDDEVVLRVSASDGLPDLVPRPQLAGSSAAAIELVYDVVDSYIESMSANGSRVILIRRDTARLSSMELAAALRYEGLVSSRALDTRRIEAVFANEKTASLSVQYQNIVFDLGPFEVERQEKGRIRLGRRGEGRIDAIELVESSKSDEWRRLLGHDVDVVPLVANLYRTQFAGLESVRVLDIPATDTAALFFNVRAPQLAEVATRRRIAGAIHRDAIARLVCGDPGCASPTVGTDDGAPLPTRLTVLVAEDDSTLQSAAKILRHQLWPRGLQVEIQMIAVPDVVRRMADGKFDLALLPLSLADHRFGFFLSPGHPKGFGMTGFASPEYDAAVEQADFATAQTILDRELPVTRLFELRSFAGIDARFCGDVKPEVSNWRWLSELYPCEEGAR